MLTAKALAQDLGKGFVGHFVDIFDQVDMHIPGPLAEVIHGRPLLAEIGADQHLFGIGTAEAGGDGIQLVKLFRVDEAVFAGNKQGDHALHDNDIDLVFRVVVLLGIPIDDHTVFGIVAAEVALLVPQTQGGEVYLQLQHKSGCQQALADLVIFKAEGDQLRGLPEPLGGILNANSKNDISYNAIYIMYSRYNIGNDAI